MHFHNNILNITGSIKHATHFLSGCSKYSWPPMDLSYQHTWWNERDICEMQNCKSLGQRSRKPWSVIVLLMTFFYLINFVRWWKHRISDKRSVKIYRVPRPGFGKNLSEKSLRPPYFFRKKLLAPIFIFFLVKKVFAPLILSLRLFFFRKKSLRPPVVGPGPGTPWILNRP